MFRSVSRASSAVCRPQIGNLMHYSRKQRVAAQFEYPRDRENHLLFLYAFFLPLLAWANNDFLISFFATKLPPAPSGLFSDTSGIRIVLIVSSCASTSFYFRVCVCVLAWFSAHLSSFVKCHLHIVCRRMYPIYGEYVCAVRVVISFLCALMLCG